ncbi:MAG: copper resistance protein B [Sideroxydans sp.]|nr:copper resistance protein B [Sideroxydans sp.]
MNKFNFCVASFFALATSVSQAETTHQHHAMPDSSEKLPADEASFGEFGRPHMMGEENMGGVLLNRLERTQQKNSAYELLAVYGQPFNRAVLKADGVASNARLTEARTELLWAHGLDAFWDRQLGARIDSGALPSRTWAALGVQGIAPYWFNVEATAYLGEQARSALRVAVEYDVLLTQKLLLQPRLESNFYGQTDAARNLGSGLSDATLGLRLRYEIEREFAPYLGVERANKFSASASFARAAGEASGQTRWVAGLRMWF